MIRIPFLLTLIIGVLLCNATLAEQLLSQEPLSEFDLFEEIPIVLSAARLQQSAHDTPSSITVISRQMIKASGVRDIADIFNFVPGFQVGYEQGTNPVVTYHGLSDQFQRRMQILVDGRSVYQPNWGGAAWANLPLMVEDIERIEIIRGPNAASFGSNAFKATINIITQHSLSSQGSYVKVLSGTNNVAQMVLRQGGRLGDFSYRLSAGHEQDNGYLDPDLGGHYDIDRWDYKYAKKFTFRGDYQVDINDVLRVNAGYTDGEFGDRLARTYYGVDKRRYYAHIGWDHQFSEVNQTSLQLYLNRANDLDYFESVKLANEYNSVDNPLPIDRSERSQRYELEFQQTYSPDRGVRLAWGASSRLNQVKSYYHYHTYKTVTQRQHRLFINAEQSLTEKNLLNVGVMAEKTARHATKLSPRASINHHLTKSQTIRLSVSRAYRAPLTYEEFADTRLTDSGELNDIEILAVNELQPEKITSVDLGYVFQARNSPFAVDLRLFREEIRDIITPYFWISPALGVNDDFIDPDVGAGTLKTFANDDQANLQGFESQFSYSPSRTSRLQLTYSYIDIKSTHKSRDALLANFSYEYNDYLYDISAPQHSASLLAYMMPTDTLQLTLAYHWVDRMKWNGGIGDNLARITYRSMVPRHDRIDLRLGMPFSSPNFNGEITFNIRNLLDDDHYDYQKHHKSQRHTYLGLSIEFD